MTQTYQRVWREAKRVSLHVPYENFVGAVLGGRFQLQFLRHQEDHIDIYSVKSLGGLYFEAQAFSLSSLPVKLLHARKRRMKRINQSQNFVCEIEQAGKKFLVLDVKRSDAEWANLTRKPNKHVSDYETCSNDFPGLIAARCHRTDSFSSISSEKVADNH
jgi:hypothetical protein